MLLIVFTEMYSDFTTRARTQIINSSSVARFSNAQENFRASNAFFN